jgi:hypothetical protein
MGNNCCSLFQELPIMKNALLLLCLLSTIFGVCFASEPNAIRDKILHDTTIQGFPCAHGIAWFYPDGALNQCTFSRPVTLGDLRVPRDSVVELWPNGAARYLMLPRPTVLDRYRVRATSRIGFARGTTTSFYRTGELRSLYLLRNQTVQTVPCSGGAWNTLSDPSGAETRVEFYPDGNLESCRLSRDFSGFRTGQRIVLPNLTAATASSAPSPSPRMKAASAR